MTGLTAARAKLSWRFVLWTTVFTLLLLPLAAMQVTREVAWTAFDFAAAALLLIGTAVACELVARSRLTGAARIIVGAGTIAVAALLWAHGAIGVF